MAGKHGPNTWPPTVLKFSLPSLKHEPPLGEHPASERILGGNLMTVHPLGGCTMIGSWTSTDVETCLTIRPLSELRRTGCASDVRFGS